MPKKYSVGLQNSVSGSYSPNSTYVTGGMIQKTLPAPYNTSQVIGSPFSKFTDVQTDTAPIAAVLAGTMCFTANGHKYVLASTLAQGLANVILRYDVNQTTGVSTYVGKIFFAVASLLTPTSRGIAVDDSNPSNVKIFIGCSPATTTTGGLLQIWGVTLASFTPTGTQYYTAQASGQTGVYLCVSPYEIGGAQLALAPSAVSVPGTWASNPALNTKVLLHNGVSGTHQYYVFDYATTPNINTLPVGTASTAGTATFTYSTNHGLAVSDTVVITVNNPTGFTLSAPTTAQAVYFVIATGLTATQFQLSLTLGGAAVVASSTTSNIAVTRALGSTSNQFVVKTANLPTAGAGTMITATENCFIPQSGPNSGQDCVFFATTTNFLQGRIQDLWSTQTGTLNGTTTVTGLNTSGLFVGQPVYGTGAATLPTISIINNATTITLSVAATLSGATSLTFGANTWPSFMSVNVSGTGTDYVVPVPSAACYDSVLDKVVYLTPSNIVMIKNFVNSSVVGSLGNSGNTIYEAQSHVTDPLAFLAAVSLECTGGWLFVSSNATVGQRGIISVNLKSDDVFGITYLTTPVYPTPGKQTLIEAYTDEVLYSLTATTSISYRTSANIGDAIFSSPTGGWIPLVQGISANAPLSNFTQFRVGSQMINTPAALYSPASETASTPAQIIDVNFVTVLLAEISDYWDYSHKDSSGGIPTSIAFALRTAYVSGVVPKLTLTVYDVGGTLIGTYDTVTHAANFTFSNDSGASFNPLGTIPNVVNTTRLKFTFTTPPGVDVRVGLME